MDEHNLKNEFKTLYILPVKGIVARIRGGDLTEWHCTAIGDEFTIYKGALFYYTIKFLDAFNSKLPIVTVLTPNAFLPVNTPIPNLFTSEQWAREPNARFAMTTVRRMLSGVDVPASNQTDAAQMTIAIRSVVYTKLNPKWIEMFPELVAESGELDDLHLQKIQQLAPPEDSNAPTSNSSSFSQALHHSAPVIAINASEVDARPASTDVPLRPASRSPPTVSSSPTATSSSMPHSSEASPSKSKESKTSHAEAAPSSIGASSLDSSASNKPIFTPETLPVSEEPISTQISRLSSEEGIVELYVAIFSHLQQNIQGWQVNEDPSTPSRLGVPVRAGSGRALSSRVESLTCGSNPRLSFLCCYSEDFGSEMGPLAQGKHGVFVKMSADFGPWHKIRTSTADWSGLDSNMPEGEAQREYARQLIVQVLDGAMYAAWSKLRVRLVFAEIDLCSTEGSMRAVFQGTSPAGMTFARETEVEKLNLSSTRTSPRSLLSLHKLSNLQELFLDHCPSIQKSGKNVFSLLLKKDSIPSLTSLSVVGTSQVMSASWIIEVEQRCPNLKKLFFTRQPGVKALGWSDNVLMQTMRDPLLMPCGHIGDRASLLSLGYCAFDRQSFRVSDLASLNPNTTMLEKDAEGKWNATIVDTGRKPLDAKVLYHRQCGAFYNLDSLKEIYDLEQTEINADVLDSLRQMSCQWCRRQFGNNTRICFPNSAEPSEKQGFDNLKDFSNYGTIK